VISLEATGPRPVAVLRAEAYEVAEKALRRLDIPYARPRTDQWRTVGDMLDAATDAWSDTAKGPALRFPTYAALRGVLSLDLSEVAPARRPAAVWRQLLWSRSEGDGRESLTTGLGAAGTLLSISGTRWTSGMAANVLLVIGYSLLGAAVAPLFRRVFLLGLVGRLQWLWWRNGQRGWIWDQLLRLHAQARSTPSPAGTATTQRLPNRLLVDAVLLDLRRSYRRSRWLASWPTVYPVLVIPPGPAAADTGPPVTLLHAQVRTPRSPLVTVVAGPVPLADGWAGGGDVQPLERWRERLGDSRSGVPGQALWRIRLTPTPSGMTPSPPVPASTTPSPTVRLRDRLWWESGPLRSLAAVTVLLVLTVATVTIRSVLAPPVATCGADQQSVQDVVDDTHGQPPGPAQLIGYRLCGEPFADPPGPTLQAAAVERLRGYQRDIFAQNQWVDARPATEITRRQVLTLVAISALTTVPGDRGSSVMAEAEGLAGIYAVQYAVNHAPGDGPFLKVVVANAGGRGAHADRLVALLKPLLASAKLDHRHAVLGAVVTVNSTTTAQDALAGITDLPVTLISPTMTGDNFGARLPRFYQMITPNAQQATLVVDYVRKVYPGRQLVDIYPAPAPSDLYVRSLKTDLETQAGRPSRQRVDFRAEEWALGASLTAHCDGGEVLFYGGRYNDFGAFVSQLNYDCPGRIPPVIADDSTSRLLSDGNLAAQIPAKVPVALATKSLPLTCGQLDIPAFAGATAGPAPGGVPPRAQFQRDIRDALHRCVPNERTSDADAAGLAGGWAAASYDATRVLHWAIGQNMHPDDDPTTVADRTAQLLKNGTLPFGVNSPVAFNGGNVAVDGRISLYCIQNLPTAFHAGNPADAAIEVIREGKAYPADRTGPTPTPCGPTRATS
jgi:ABC-type branched-subunit amino acid transport system substrate-binding protein